MNIAVVGGGSWGTAFARLLFDHGHEVTLACRDPEQAAAIRETGRNPRYMTSVDLTGIVATTIDEAQLEDANLVVLAVPSAAFAGVVAGAARQGAGAQPHEGPRPGDGRPALDARPRPARRRPLRARTSRRRSHAGLPAAAVIACDNLSLAVQLQLAITSGTFRVYVNDDLVGVELCAAAKNVIALAAGGADGLGLGDNAKAALVARGLAEMGRLADAAGARPETFAGLAGMGDLIVTCWSKSGRNRRAGELIAQGATQEEAIRSIGMVVEGLTTAPVLRDLAHRLELELPITEGVCAVLGGVSLGELVGQLMEREPTVRVDTPRSPRHTRAVLYNLTS